jgi:hypothetical protein
MLFFEILNAFDISQISVTSSIFFYFEYYFVYLFCAALYRLLLELFKTRCIVVLAKKRPVPFPKLHKSLNLLFFI